MVKWNAMKQFTVQESNICNIPNNSGVQTFGKILFQGNAKARF